jgi:UDP-GlcNAc:undecaprenyl-phosphate GlcNAc-1-phosphate transferase
MTLWWFLPILAAWLLSLVLTAIVRHLALRHNLVDAPDGGRKLHSSALPFGGGVAIYLAFTIPSFAVLFSTNHFTSGAIKPLAFVGLLLGGLVLTLGGLLDDRYRLPAKKSIVFPVLAALIAVACGIGVTKLTNPFGSPFLLPAAISSIFTFCWLLATTYTTKLLDGLDGLATSIASIAALLIMVLSLSAKFWQPDVALLAAIAAAAMLGFLLWNWHPARIFLGEGGSTLLGFLVGVLAVISGGKVATALLVLGIPALDVVFVIIRRLARRQNPFTASDRDHLHYLLLDHGLSARQVVLFYVVFALIFGVTSLFLVSWQKLIILAILALVASIMAISLHRTN